MASPPRRLADTRIGLGARGPISPKGTFELTVSTAAPGATAVVLNLTVVEARGPGYLQVVPSGGATPLGTSSNVNVERAGQTVSNVAVVPVGTGGRITIYHQAGGQVVIDLLGAFSPAERSADGRLVLASPTRLADTRSGLGARGPVGPGGAFDLWLWGAAPGSNAVVLNVTAEASTGPGYLQVVPTGGPTALGTSSNLNVEATGQSRAALVLVPLGPDGRITIFDQAGGDVIIDLLGWFTSPGEPVDDTGLFVAVPPSRLLDTRDRGAPIGPDGTATFRATGRARVPTSGVGGVFLNVTATDTAGPGIAQAFAVNRTALGATANLQVERADQTLANAALSGVGDGGLAALYLQGGGHAIADVAGWFTGPNRPATTPPPVGRLAVNADWQGALAWYRAASGLAPPDEEPAWTPSVSAHARWMVLNQRVCHCEEPGTAGYSAAGAEAAAASDLIGGWGRASTDRVIIEEWLTGPFHAAYLLAPSLRRVAYGAASSATWWAAALDVIRGREPSQPADRAYLFPTDGAVVSALSYGGGEHPDPLTSCPGYRAPVGMPLLVRMPAPAAGSQVWLSGPSGDVPLCVFDGSSYTNDDQDEQQHGRQILNDEQIVVAFPRAPLPPGLYWAAATSAGGQAVHWSFVVSG